VKKFLISIVAFVYLLSITGVTIQQHYCMDKLVGLSFFQQDKDMCGKCGMEKSEKQDGCCKDVTIKVKNWNDQFKSFFSILSEKKGAQHDQDFFIYKPELKIQYSKKYLADHGPPYLTILPLFILNGVFRI
jgi:hypothetical protein